MFPHLIYPCQEATGLTEAAKSAARSQIIELAEGSLSQRVPAHIKPHATGIYWVDSSDNPGLVVATAWNGKTWTDTDGEPLANQNLVWRGHVKVFAEQMGRVIK